MSGLPWRAMLRVLPIPRALFVVLVVVMSFICWLLPASNADASSPRRLYIALGDSVTQFGSTSGLRYPERFFADLQQAGAADELQNIGVGGETSSSILGGQLTRALQLINDTATNTTVATLDIGGNDFLGNPSCNPTSPQFSLDACQPTLSAFATNYRSLLDQLNAALANEPAPHQLMVMTYYNPWSGRSGEETSAANSEVALLGSDRTLDCAGQGTALGLNDLIACIGAQHGASVADVYPSFVGMGAQWFSDPIHPNDAGHAAIASVFAAAFGHAGHSTNTGVSCSPGTVVEGSSTMCTASVTDTASSGQTTPTGAVTFGSDSAGGFSAGSCVLSGTGASASCSVLYTPTAPSSGTHTLTASYPGDGSHGASAGTAGVTVSDAVLTATGSTVAPVEDGLVTQTVATFTDADPAGTASDYVATIDWGDGTATIGTVAASGSGFTISGSHRYAEEGSEKVTIIIRDSGGATAAATSAANVSDAPLKARGVRKTRHATFAGTIATFTDQDSAGRRSDYRAAIRWGDGRTTFGRIASRNGRFKVLGSHHYRRSGVFHVKVTIRDKGGSETTARSKVKVRRSR